ncbi:MAG: hypothetical protein WB767_13775 [Nocardioides sp.]
MRNRRVAQLAAPMLLLGSCSIGDVDPPSDPGRVVLTPAADGAAPHTHATTIGDGTTPDAGGYRLTGLSFPQKSRVPGNLSFRIEDSYGDVVTDFQEEQTKLLHLYVVRDDLADFRHLHPTIADDGTWTARVDLADPGRYRVIAEFVPSGQPDGSHVVLGERALVPGEWTPTEVPATSIADDGLVTIEAPSTMTAGSDERMTLTVSDGAGGVLNLGTYLGSYAHLTGFDVETGAFVHAHPLGAPDVTSEGSELLFHTAFNAPGEYRFFVQVRVDGFVHTVPVTSTVV